MAEATTEDASTESPSPDELRYRLAIDASHMGVWDWDIKSGDIYVDPKLKLLLGYEDHEIQNQIDDWSGHVYHEDVAAVMEVAQAHMDGETPYYDIEHRMVHKDGTLRWFLARGQILRDGDGRPYRMVGTDTDITDRKEAQEALRVREGELRQRTEELHRANEDLHRELRERQAVEEALRETEEERSHLIQRLMPVQEDEQAHIARELHDQTGQALTSLLIGMKLLEDAAGQGPMGQRISDLREVVAKTLDDVRTLSFSVHPGTPEDTDLVDALRSDARRLSKQLGVRVDVEANGTDGGNTPLPVGTAVYRVVHAALTNASKHAEADHISIVVHYRPDRLSVIVEDDGVGFDVNAVLSGPVEGRFGLLAMRERLRPFGGTVTFESQPGEGATVYVSAPTSPTEVAQN